LPAANKGINELVAIGFSNGSLKLITKTGKVDKEIKDAHKDAAVRDCLNLFNNFMLNCLLIS